MVRRCPDCQADLDRWGDRHRCTTKIVGARKPSRLEAEQIAKGHLDASVLTPKAQPATQPAGRLAPKHSGLAPLALQPQATCACRADEVLSAISKLTAAFEKLQATLTPRTDA